MIRRGIKLNKQSSNLSLEIDFFREVKHFDQSSLRGYSYLRSFLSFFLKEFATQNETKYFRLNQHFVDTFVK